MRGAMVILVAMVVIGVLLYVWDVIAYRRKGRDLKHDHSNNEETVIGRDDFVETAEAEKKVVSKGDQPLTTDHGEFCCGMHLVCEKGLERNPGGEIIYYDDEELDRFKGRADTDYTPEETEEFRDVLMTLLPEDVAGWAESIRRREIELPGEIREELLMILSEAD